MQYIPIQHVPVKPFEKSVFRHTVNSSPFYREEPLLYTWIMSIWLILMITFEYYIITGGIIPNFQNNKPIVASLLIFNQVFVATFFFFGVSNLAIPIAYQLVKDREKFQELRTLRKPLPKGWHPRVQLLYTTYNDFIPYALNQCLHQSYPVKGVILDNSTDPVYINKIRQFVKVHPDVDWIRDVPNHHAKAGNLDNYLCNEGKGTYDYFVILDSDELLEPRFVEKCLKMFYYTHHLGILQCNHISGRNCNSFMRTFANSGNVFWPVQNTVRSVQGGILQPSVCGKDPSALTRGSTVAIGLGHGVMISKECFDDIGMFPYMVAEDLCTSIEAILKGWNIKFASQIYGNEEFPVNMEALMVRSSKFCSANFQFFNQYWKRIRSTKMLSVFQKLDLLSFTLSVPIFAIQYISLLICSIILPLNHAQMGYQFFMIIPTLICYFSQSLPDAVFTYQNGMKIHKIISYEFQTMLLYGSFYYITVKCTLLAFLRKPAKFNVTPKVNKKITIKQAFKENWESILFSTITIVVAIICSGSSWVLLSFFPGCLGFLIALKANYMNANDRKKARRFDQYDHYALYEPQKKPLKWYE